ncbi:MAG TPA: arginine deiminase family protein [Thermomicrobiales bacterium]
MSLTGAYGGEKWSPRTQSRREEMADIWGEWGAGSECSRLRAVLLHRPGPELDEIEDFDAVQMRADLRPDLARAQHDAMADAYEAEGVAVHYVEGYRPDKPNQLFCRDLMTMSPEGAILARPASTVRAGEERVLAETLGILGVPILMSVHGTGTFEGADAMWAAPDLCFVAEGLRTNRAGAEQVTWALQTIGVTVERVMLPYGAMHLDGMLNFAAPDLAVVWPRRTPMNIVRILQERGVRILHLLDEPATHDCLPGNFVALAPNRILMPTGAPRQRAIYEDAGITCIEVDVSELIKAGGGIHCMTAFLSREEAGETG